MSGFSRAYDEASRIPGQPIPIKPPVREAGVYPIEALSPKLQAAARGVMDKVQVPASIAANSLLAVASLAVQPFINVRLPTGEEIPPSLFAVTIGSSGERKSSVDKIALKPVRERERILHDIWAQAQEHYQADKAAHAAAMTKAKSGSRSRDDIRGAIENVGPEPLPPPQPVLVVDEPTLQGLQKLFAEAMPSLGMFSDEGGQWLGGYAMGEEQRGATGAALSKLWDGASIKRTRGTDGFTVLRGRRLSLHLMVQHRIAARLFSDPDLKDQGLLSRILIASPKSLKGERFWKRPQDNSTLDIEKYQSRVFGLLSAELPMDLTTRELDPATIELSPEAVDLFVAFHDAVEVELRPGGAFDDISGFAAKLPEHAVRLAAVMAYFEDRHVREISAQALSHGIRLAQFYADEALRVIGAGLADEDTENAAAMIAWIRAAGYSVIGKRHLSQRVTPKNIRPMQVFRRALDLCVEAGHLKKLDGDATIVQNGAPLMVAGRPAVARDAYAVVSEEDDG